MPYYVLNLCENATLYEAKNIKTFIHYVHFFLDHFKLLFRLLSDYNWKYAELLPEIYGKNPTLNINYEINWAACKKLITERIFEKINEYDIYSSIESASPYNYDNPCINLYELKTKININNWFDNYNMNTNNDYPTNYDYPTSDDYSSTDDSTEDNDEVVNEDVHKIESEKVYTICAGCKSKNTLIENQHTSVMECTICGLVNEQLLDNGTEGIAIAKQINEWFDSCM